MVPAANLFTYILDLAEMHFLNTKYKQHDLSSDLKPRSHHTERQQDKFDIMLCVGSFCRCSKVTRSLRFYNTNLKVKVQ